MRKCLNFKNILRSHLALCTVLFGLFLAAGTFAEVITFDGGQEDPVRVAVPTFQTNDIKNIMKWLNRSGFKARSFRESAEFDISEYDALVIPGGGDINAPLYGEENDDSNYFINLDYDEFEIRLVHEFAEAGKPILGICRGEQLINVAFGGTLEQDIPGTHIDYREIRLAPSSFLYESLGDSAVPYHNHHQCIDKLGSGLIADAWDKEDGRIEGIHHETLPIYGLQFHPELEGEKNGLDKVVAEAFMKICREEKEGS